jgi:hypothetical protein
MGMIPSPFFIFQACYLLLALFAFGATKEDFGKWLSTLLETLQEVQCA